MPNYSNVLVLVSVLFFAKAAFALECYKCTDPLGLNLECENLDNIPALNCPLDVCALYVIKNPDGSRILHRRCSQQNICREIENQYATRVERCETCNDDRCNSANQTMLSALLLFMTLLFVTRM